VRRSLIPKNYTPRLACVKPAASVHPEPGSNSSSYIFYIILRLRFYWSYSNLAILLLFILCFKISLKTAVNSICLGTCSFYFVSLVSQSGCKSRKTFSNWQEKFEVFFREIFILNHFFSYQSFKELSLLLRGAKVLPLFKSTRIFRDFFKYFSKLFFNNLIITNLDFVFVFIFKGFSY
jgi:hypothetical protein